MSDLHPSLARQLRKLGLNASAPPTSQETWTAFLERVSQAYREADDERSLVEHPFEPSTREMAAVHRALEARSADELACSRDELARTVALLHATMESMTDALAITGLDDRVLVFNRRFAELWELPSDALARMNDREMREHLAQRVAGSGSVLQRPSLQDHASDSAQDEVSLKDGRTCTRLTAPVLDAAGHCLGRMWLLRDITEQRLAERALVDARNAAQQANRAKAEFLSSMSHELRTPLNAILGFGNLLAAGRGGPLSAMQADYLQYIVGAGEHMLALVNDLLDLRRIEEDRFDLALSAQPVAPLVEAAISMVTPLVAEKGHHFRIELPPSTPRVRCDARNLVRVLVNLLGNAAKYTTPSGSVCLRVHVYDTEVCFEIEDSGIAVSQEDQARLLDYAQLEPGTEYHMRGSGVGLALARTLTERMGGRIDVCSTVRRGSRFRVWLPREPASG